MVTKKILINIIVCTLIAIVSELIFIPSAEAMTQESFQWTGATGYSVRGTFSYDENTTTKIISEQGYGKTNNLQSLIVTFYHPSGKPIHQYKNVVNGESQGNYFEFNLDTNTQQLFGNIDLGGEQSGDIFLKGTIDRQLSLIAIESSGKEHILDRSLSYQGIVFKIKGKKSN